LAACIARSRVLQHPSTWESRHARQYVADTRAHAQPMAVKLGE
jgi:hypothetical protein